MVEIDPNKRSLFAGGFSLVELLLSITIMAFVAGVASTSISVFLKAHSYSHSQTKLYSESMIAMERMTEGVRSSTFLLIPNGNNTVRDVLAYSGGVNEDNDFYFGDTLFPRIDEDITADAGSDGQPGIDLLDDDGDSSTDEGGDAADDDEDGLIDEDPLDGLDNDGDGAIDEDGAADFYGDGAPGILNMDDDGDGSVDEGGDATDDDEDGSSGEDPFNFTAFRLVSGELIERNPVDGNETVIASSVSDFTVSYEPPVAGVSAPRVLISLSLDDGVSEPITITEYVYPRNTVQKTGKRVR
jgi:type II secretory pathway pseudopilin PulG